MLLPLYAVHLSISENQSRKFSDIQFQWNCHIRWALVKLIMMSKGPYTAPSEDKYSFLLLILFQLFNQAVKNVALVVKEIHIYISFWCVFHCKCVRSHRSHRWTFLDRSKMYSEKTANARKNEVGSFSKEKKNSFHFGL